jgi:hypothetical protein
MDIVTILVFAAVNAAALAIGLGLGYATLSGVLALMRYSLYGGEEPTPGGTVVRMPMRSVQTADLEEALVEAA